LPEKPDAERIRTLWAIVQRRQWGPTRRRWPEFIWHYSDVRNVARILRSGYVRSRNRLVELGEVFVDIASPEVINHSKWSYDYARFYFRPVTPTQFHMEGIRSPQEIAAHRLHAHCPVPVFLLFDAVPMLVRYGAYYCRGNFGSASTRVDGTADFLASFTFEDVYHDGAIPVDRKSLIVSARNSEVIYQREVDLSSLREVVCRSAPERQTLLTLLGDAAETWRPIIRTEASDERIFFRSHTYVEDVRLLPDAIHFRVHVAAGEYPVTVLIRTPDSVERTHTGLTIQGPHTSTVTAPVAPQYTRVYAELRFCDDCLAFAGFLSRKALFWTASGDAA
jgi:hypothetical protein